MVTNTRREWIHNHVNSSRISHTSLRDLAREDWYFVNGYSKHMTGVNTLFKNIKSYSTGYVTFKDGAKCEIKGVGRLACTGLPSLDNVLLVKSLTANLISIDQLCDKGIKINFTKSECLVTGEKNKVMMKGVGSKDNYYLWASQEINFSSTCWISKEDEVNPWHQKLGHLHLKGMKKIVSKEVIRGIPKLKT